jgi:hypothetical protein
MELRFTGFLYFSIFLLALLRHADSQHPHGVSSVGYTGKPKKVIGTAINVGAYNDFNCSRLLYPVLQNRTRCFDQSKTEVDLCVVFATDYHYIIPFLVHYLALGVHRVHLYNNDQTLAWYLHPSIVCLVQAGLVEIQPWRGAGEYNDMMADCWKRKVLEPRGLNVESARNRDNLWMGIFDVDEMMVLHNHQCLNSMLDDYPNAPAVAFDWAFFLPPYDDTSARTARAKDADPLSIFGNIKSMPDDHFELINYPRPTAESPMVIFPHDMTIMRRFECGLIKSITRPGCISKIYNPHFAELSPSCPQGTSPHDPEHHVIKSGYATPWVDNHYPIAQLNHYWTTSLRDFLRKIHRGIGSDVPPEKGSFRSSDMFVERASTRHGNEPTRDTSFLERYGSFYKSLKMDCPDCFRLDIIINSEHQ